MYFNKNKTWFQHFNLKCLTAVNDHYKHLQYETAHINLDITCNLKCNIIQKFSLPNKKPQLY